MGYLCLFLPISNGLLDIIQYPWADIGRKWNENVFLRIWFLVIGFILFINLSEKELKNDHI